MSCNTFNNIAKKITDFINSCENEVTINISRLSFIDATRTALLKSTECYARNPEKKINWIVKNKAVKDVIMPYKLENMKILTSKKEI